MSEDAVVGVESGLLKGLKKKSILGQDYYAFLGVPYAEPPVGPLRFKDPRPISPWSGLRDATKEGNPCASKDMLTDEFVGSDDCLYLNVFTPNLKTPKTCLKPVMVWIHGGGFMVGSSSSELYGPDFLINHEVILVTLNYRLGVLGFLYVPECGIGNAGLKDQNFALHWVKNNIMNFGGDPNNITIFGESAGAASVGYQLMSPLSANKDLFHKAILQSGAPFNCWAHSLTTYEKSFEMAKLFNKETKDPVDLISCLQSIPALELAKMQYNVTKAPEDKHFIYGPFLPTTEKGYQNIFLPEHPEEMMKKGNFINVPIIAGVVSDEGMFALKRPEHTNEYLTTIDDNFHYFVNHLLRQPIDNPKLKNIAAEVKKYYFSSGKVSLDNLYEYVNLQTDLLIGYKTQKMIEYFMEKSKYPVYHYLYNFDGKFNFMRSFFTNHQQSKGVAHADDLFSIFYSNNMGSDLEGTRELKQIKKMTKLWTNFAKIGNPNLDENNPLWQPSTTGERKYLVIKDDYVLKDGVIFEERVKFWDDITKKINSL